MMPTRSIVTTVVVLLLFTCAASAELLQSREGLSTCVNTDTSVPVALNGPNSLSPAFAPPLLRGCGNYTTVRITTNSAWQPAPPPGQRLPVWISYADTGQDGTNYQPYGGANNTNRDATKWIFQVFQPIALGNTFFHLRVWADDTAGVYLDDAPLKAPVFTQSTCSGQPIGCRPQDVGPFDMALDPSEAHMLRFDVYQVGTGLNTNNNPMGLLYDGYAVPEPSSILLLGTVLFGATRLLRRKSA